MFDREEATAAIKERNRMRVRAKLPPLRVADELARLASAYEKAAFDEFVRANRPLYERIWNRKVAQLRKRATMSDYEPQGWTTMMGFDAYVRRVLRRIYRRTDKAKANN